MNITDSYVGFSSKKFEKNKNYTMYGAEVVKEDLRNHIFTRRGERVKMPTFGTRIPDLPYQPLDEYTISIVDEDLRKVFNYDPRVSLITLRILPLYEESAIMAIADLNFIYLNFNDRMDIRIEFENR